MKKRGFHISAAAILLLALIYYFCPTQTLLAVLVPVIVHEAGHVLALFSLGMRIRGLRIECRGFCIDYCGVSGAVGHALAAAAGPIAGFSYALAASWWGGQMGSDWLCLSAGVSLLLSLFNLLPALPLDGGQILLNLSCAFLGERRGLAVTEACSLVIGVLLLSLGVWLLGKGHGIGILAAAIWLLLYQEGRQGLVKVREIL